MSRYIDADALDRAFSKLRFNNDGELNHYGDRPNWYLWGSEIENLIADAPSIDIVFCKECKHSEYREEFEDYECHSSGCGLVYDAYFYCADGERRTDE